MHGNVKFTVQWGSPCWELWICALFNKIVNKIFSEDFAQQLSIIVQFLHISTIPHKIEEMGMTIILKLLFLNSLLASNVHIFVCVFLFFHLSFRVGLAPKPRFLSRVGQVNSVRKCVFGTCIVSWHYTQDNWIDSIQPLGIDTIQEK